MEVEKRLYLIGGSQAFESIAESFLAAAGGWNAWIALLLQTNEFTSFRYLPKYVTPWAKHGIRGYEAFGPKPDGELELDRLSCILEKATGIFIGGGDTAAYREGAGILFRNGDLVETFGDSIHKVKIHNALLQDYEVTTI